MKIETDNPYISKLIVLDVISQITYVIPYDINVYEDALECISNYSDDRELNISLSNCLFMEVSDVNIVFL